MTKEPFLFSGETARVEDRKKNLSSGCDVREKTIRLSIHFSNYIRVNTFALAINSLLFEIVTLLFMFMHI